MLATSPGYVIFPFHPSIALSLPASRTALGRRRLLAFVPVIPSNCLFNALDGMPSMIWHTLIKIGFCRSLLVFALLHLVEYLHFQPQSLLFHPSVASGHQLFFPTLDWWSGMFWQSCKTQPHEILEKFWRIGLRFGSNVSACINYILRMKHVIFTWISREIGRTTLNHHQAASASHQTGILAQMNQYEWINLICASVIRWLTRKLHI